jgi:hypothetical protein
VFTNPRNASVMLCKSDLGGETMCGEAAETHRFRAVNAWHKEKGSVSLAAWDIPTLASRFCSRCRTHIPAPDCIPYTVETTGIQRQSSADRYVKGIKPDGEILPPRSFRSGTPACRETCPERPCGRCHETVHGTNASCMTHPLSVNGTDTRLGGRYANAKPHMFIAFVREFRQRTAGDERARERLFTVLPGPEFSPCHVHRHGAPLQIARAGVYVSRDKRISSPKPLPASLRVTASVRPWSDQPIGSSYQPAGVHLAVGMTSGGTWMDLK